MPRPNCWFGLDYTPDAHATPPEAVSTLADFPDTLFGSGLIRRDGEFLVDIIRAIAGLSGES